MIQLDNIKSFVHIDREKKVDMILPMVTTLISGLVIILSISPEYLRELNPITLFLLSVASALPVWAFNQFLWWHLGRKISSELVGKIAYVLEVSEKRKKVISIALSQLVKVVDIIRLIPSKDIANLATIITIYLGAVVTYFTQKTPFCLYGTIFMLSVIIWLFGLFVLHRTSRKIDVEPLKLAWHQLKKDEELLVYINQHLERIEQLILQKYGLLHIKKDSASSVRQEEDDQ